MTKAEVLLFMFIFVLCGCVRFDQPTQYAPQPMESWTYSDASKPIINKDYAISITPEYWSSYRRDFGWQCFKLSVENKTKKNIEIVWDKTFFVTNGSTSGGFMFDGIIYRDRNNQKPNDIVFGNSTFNRLILPNNLLEYIASVGWLHKIIPPGETGVYITMIVDGKEINERVIINIQKN